MGELFKGEYDRLQDEFHKYQRFAEKQIQSFNEKNIELEKKLDCLENIIEIGKYINSYISNENLIYMINDMIVGVLGVTYCTIYLREDKKLLIKATNLNKDNLNLSKKELEFVNKENSFLINQKEQIFESFDERRDIHSIIGVPIKVREEFTGYVIGYHTLNNFFTNDHIKFITSMANQIAVAIENSMLYKKIQESLKIDNLLNIYNRKAYFDMLKDKIKNQLHNNIKQKFAIVMMDIDDFKSINDTFGHIFGDEVLINSVNVIKSFKNREDIIARYGGEEIIMYIEFKTIAELMEKVNLMRKSLQYSKVKYDGNVSNVTASFGIAIYPDDYSGDGDIDFLIKQLVKEADRVLYVAKNSGKNIIVTTWNEKEFTNY